MARRYSIGNLDPNPAVDTDAITGGVQNGLALITALQEDRRAERLALASEADKTRIASRQLDLDSQQFQLELAKSRRDDADSQARNFLEAAKMRREQATSDLNMLMTIKGLQIAERSDQAKIKYSGLLQDATISPNSFSRSLALEELKTVGAYNLFDPETQKQLAASAQSIAGISANVGEESFTMQRAVANLRSQDPLVRTKAGAVALSAGVPATELERYLSPAELASATKLSGVTAYDNQQKAQEIVDWAHNRAELDKAIPDSPEWRDLNTKVQLAEGRIGKDALEAYAQVRSGRLPVSGSDALAAAQDSLARVNQADPAVAQQKANYAAAQQAIMRDPRLKDDDRKAKLAQLAAAVPNEESAQAGLSAISDLLAKEATTPGFLSTDAGGAAVADATKKLDTYTRPYFRFRGKREPLMEDFISRDGAVMVAGGAEANRQNQNEDLRRAAAGLPPTSARERMWGLPRLGESGEIVATFDDAVRQLNELNRFGAGPAEGDKAAFNHVYAQVKDYVRLVDGGNGRTVYVPVDRLVENVKTLTERQARDLLLSVGRASTEGTRYGFFGTRNLGLPGAEDQDAVAKTQFERSRMVSQDDVDALVLSAFSGDAKGLEDSSEKLASPDFWERDSEGFRRGAAASGLSVDNLNYGFDARLRNNVLPGIQNAWQLGAAGRVVYSLDRALNPEASSEEVAGYIKNAYSLYQKDKELAKGTPSGDMYRLSATLRDSLPGLRSALLSQLRLERGADGATVASLPPAVRDAFGTDVPVSDVEKWLYSIANPGDRGLLTTAPAATPAALPPPAGAANGEAEHVGG